MSPSTRRPESPDLPPSHHVGLLVASCARRLAFFDGCGFATTKPRTDPYVVTSEGHRVVMTLTIGFADDGNVLFEVIEPADDGSPLAGQLRDRGEGLHHIAYVVPDLAGTTARLERAGLRPIVDATGEPDRSRWRYLADPAGAAPVIELIQTSAAWDAFTAGLVRRR